LDYILTYLYLFLLKTLINGILFELFFFKIMLIRHIQNANLPRKIFLFAGASAFVYWIFNVNWSWIFIWGNIEVLWTNTCGQNALWVMFISIVGSYVFQPKKRERE